MFQYCWKIPYINNIQMSVSCIISLLHVCTYICMLENSYNKITAPLQPKITTILQHLNPIKTQSPVNYLKNTILRLKMTPWISNLLKFHDIPLQFVSVYWHELRLWAASGQTDHYLYSQSAGICQGAIFCRLQTGNFVKYGQSKMVISEWHVSFISVVIMLMSLFLMFFAVKCRIARYGDWYIVLCDNDLILKSLIWVGTMNIASTFIVGITSNTLRRTTKDYNKV